MHQQGFLPRRFQFPFPSVPPSQNAAACFLALECQVPSLSLLCKCTSKLLGPGFWVSFSVPLLQMQQQAYSTGMPCSLFIFLLYKTSSMLFAMVFQVLFLFPSFSNSPPYIWHRDARFFSFIRSSKLFFPLSLLSKMQQCAFWHLEVRFSSLYPSFTNVAASFPQ